VLSVCADRAGDPGSRFVHRAGAPIGNEGEGTPVAGTVKRILEAIIAQRGQGNPTFVEATRAKLILKGMNPAKFAETTADDPAVVAKARQMAAEFGVHLP
jgi:hypothetical protein